MRLNGAPVQPSWTAPLPIRSSSVAIPFCTFLMSPVFEGAIDQTLASYLSTQTLPTLTESAAHLSVAACGDPAQITLNAAKPAIQTVRVIWFVLLGRRMLARPRTRSLEKNRWRGRLPVRLATSPP